MDIRLRSGKSGRVSSAGVLLAMAPGLLQGYVLSYPCRNVTESI